ncbi:MAG: glutamate synthase subunit alpha, partial [Succinivibrio sp.]|nr:glutamate synthase subunit alpha [Succinivibrio sp.]
GAAPASSVKHAGSAWEIGLADVQQTLVMNKLRSRVTLQVDGQIKTGRDVVIGALLGADEFGFGTAPLVCMGCTIMRKCQKNTCPTGIATQDPELRKQFIGTPEQLENYFHYVAREVRELMASLGIAKFDDLIGHSELLEKISDSEFEKARNLSFEKIFFKDPAFKDEIAHHAIKQQHEIDKALDKQFEAKIKEAIKNNTPVTFETPVVNVNRSVGTYSSGVVAKAVAGKKLDDNFITINLTGTAGQSFGAFLEKGITLNLSGLANDYVGKGMSGGIIAIHKSALFDGDPQDNIIAGNTCLYGATSGLALFSGVAGERFAVRNSGADAVAEGCGDHGCEYMTGGTVVILGKTGRNFAAGMSGGMAYVYDKDNTFKNHISKGSFYVSNVVKASKADLSIPLHKNMSDEEVLKDLLTKHLNATGSDVARKILENFDVEIHHFVKVFPVEYFNALKAMKEAH